MVRTREKRSQVKPVTELNYLPLMIEYFGPVRMAKLFGFLAMWELSGEPKLSDLAYRNVHGFGKSVVYKYFVWLREWGVWCRDEKGMDNIAPDIDGALQLARAALAEFGAFQQASVTQASVTVDNELRPLLT
jgi:hypothetical protein